MVTDTWPPPSRIWVKKPDKMMSESHRHEIESLISIAENILGEKLIDGLSAQIKRSPIEKWLCQRIMYLKNTYDPRAHLITKYGRVR